MKALVYRGWNKKSLEDRPKPVITHRFKLDQMIEAVRGLGLPAAA